MEYHRSIWDSATDWCSILIDYEADCGITSSMRRPSLSRADVAARLADLPSPTTFRLASIPKGMLRDPHSFWAHFMSPVPVGVRSRWALFPTGCYANLADGLWHLPGPDVSRSRPPAGDLRPNKALAGRYVELYARRHQILLMGFSFR